MKYLHWTILFAIVQFLSLPLLAQNDGIFTIAKYKNDKTCAISYTFDDGLQEHYTLVFPKFEALDFKATFWINGNTINRFEEGLEQVKPRTSWEQLKTMAAAGQEISNHGWSHKNLVRCTPEERTIEIERNDSIIKAILGIKPVTYCYAYNAKNDEIIEQASIGRVGTRTKQFSMGHKSTPENLEARVQELLQTEDWGVAMIHGITYGYDAFLNDSILWDHLEKVKKQEDKIWVATFKEVAAYTKEYENTQLQSAQKGKKWVINTKLSLDYNLFKEPLTMVVNQNNIKKISVKQGRKSIPVTLSEDKALFEFMPGGEKISVKIK